MKKIVAAVLFFILLPICHADDNNAGIASLSPELQQLFSKEMIQLNQGMQEILNAYISGQWESIVPIAKKMENSYVLRQNLTRNQMHELHTKLPENFLELDEKFHYYSGMLAHVSEMKKTELIGFYVAKMVDTCASCHRVHATKKFPAFVNQLEDKKHQH